MEQADLFKLIHTGELFTNEAIIRWMKSFPHNLGISPVIVLGELKAKGPQKQTILAKQLGYTPGAMTNIANRLIKLGLAERQYNENDRRNVLLAITESGAEIFAEAQRKGQELRTELFQVLSDEELRQYLAIHEKLLANMQTQDEDSPGAR